MRRASARARRTQNWPLSTSLRTRSSSASARAKALRQLQELLADLADGQPRRPLARILGLLPVLGCLVDGVCMRVPTR